MANLKAPPQKTYKARYLATELFEIPICLLGFSTCPSVADNKPNSNLQSVNPLRYLLSKNAGLLMAALIGLFFLNVHVSQARQAQEMITTPKVNDIYFADLHRINPRFDPIFRYSIMQVVEVNGDTVTVQMGSLLNTSPLSPFQYLTKGAYSGDSLLSSNTYVLPKSSLARFHEDGTFYNMKRPKGELIDGWLSTRFLHERECEMCNSQRYK